VRDALGGDMTDEQFVREQWESVNWGASNLSRTQYVVIVYDDKDGIAFASKTQAEAWSAAAEFTRERLEQIRQVEEEITCLDVDVRRSEPFIRPIYERILASRKAALTELKKGMR
jgi:hypothetical protein